MTAVSLSGKRKPRPRAQLIAEIAGLHAEGLTSRQVGERLGVAYSTVRDAVSDPDNSKRAARREGYKGQCVDCGATTHSDGTSRPSPRCGPCAVEESRKWTCETVIEAVQEFARIHGRPPLSVEWLRALKEPHVPVATCQALFGSWGAAIEAAGFPRPSVGWKPTRFGRGMNGMKRPYHLLHLNGDGGYREVSVEAYSPENAIEQIADSEGEWIAVLDRYWVATTVETQTKLAVVKA